MMSPRLFSDKTILISVMSVVNRPTTAELCGKPEAPAAV
jgi:hypothetical protein